MSDKLSYGAVSRAFHWSIAVLMIGLFIMGIWMGDLPRGDFKSSVYGLHKAFGMMVIVLVMARLAWRLMTPQPEAVPGPAWQQQAALAMHWALYAVTFAVPLVGWVMSDTGGRATSVFGVFTIPVIFGKNEPLHEALEEAHEILAFVMIALVVVHVAAALWHHAVRKDDTLRRMLPMGAGGGR